MLRPSRDFAYLAAIARRSPVLPHEREIELTRRFRESRDRRAADALVRAHFRMVIALALRHRHYGVALADLISEGNLGLVLALEKFDPERGVRFATYAKHWVRSRMLAYTMSTLTVLDGAAGLVKPRLFFRLRREHARVAAILGEGAAADEALAERLRVSIDEAQRLSACVERRQLSLESSMQAGGRVVDALISHEDPEQRYIQRKRAELASSALAVAMKSLDQRERFIAIHRILAPPIDELSLSQIGKAWGVSRERVRQLEERAKQKLGRCAAIASNRSLNELLMG
jgi:RNA polymerase sigma-32 factor